MVRLDSGTLTLKEDGDEPRTGRWVRIDQEGLKFGQAVLTSLDDLRSFLTFILTQAPYHLTFSDLDYDHLELAYRFDLDYRGNHDLLVAETLLGDSIAASLLFGKEAARVIDVQPDFGIALADNCSMQSFVDHHRLNLYVYSDERTFVRVDCRFGDSRSVAYEKQALLRLSCGVL